MTDIKKDSTRDRIYEYSYEQTEQKPDARMKWIYEHYHNGQLITIDDFKYLYLRDPEGCKRLVDSWIDKNWSDKKDDQRKEEQIHTKQADRSREDQLEPVLIQQLEMMNRITEDLLPMAKVEKPSAKDALANIKETVVEMNRTELLEMIQHFYETAKLRRQQHRKFRTWEKYLYATDYNNSPYRKPESEYLI